MNAGDSPRPGHRAWLQTWLPRLLVLGLALHFSRQVFPITAVEGDEQGIVNGVESWVRGSSDFGETSYLHAIQPGCYSLLFLLRESTGAPVLRIFGLASAVGAGLFVVFASFLLADATSLRPAWVAVALLTLQEITAAAAYANANAIAGAVLMAALLLSRRADGALECALAGALLGAAGWLRLDSLLAAPAVLALRWSRRGFPAAARETAGIAAAAALVLVTAFELTRLSPLDAWADFSRRPDFSGWGPFRVRGPLVMGYAASLVCAGGVAWLLARRLWRPLLLVFAGGAPSLIVYGGSLTTPKYLFYATPFLLLPGLLLLGHLLRPGGRDARLRMSVGGVLIGLQVSELLFGVQTSSAAFRRFDPLPSLTLARRTIGAKTASVGLGPGEALPTDDGPRLRGGQFWSPALWRREKESMRRECDRLDEVLGRPGSAAVVTSCYLSHQVLVHWLRSHGYKPGAPRFFGNGDASSYITGWTAENGRIVEALVNLTAHDVAEFRSSLDLGPRLLFLDDLGSLHGHRLMEGTGDWKRLSPSENGLLALYELDRTGRLSTAEAGAAGR